MALSAKDVNLLLNLLNEETCGSALTFEEISGQFHQHISPSDHLRVGNALLLLLQNRDLLPTIPQRLIIFYLVHDMYKSDSPSIHLHPFAPLFASLFLPTPPKQFHWLVTPVTPSERGFVQCLISQRDVSKRTPNECLQLSMVEENGMKEKMEELPVTGRCHLPALINDPEWNNYGFDALTRHRGSDRRQTIERLWTSNAMGQTIRPESLRLVPPLHSCQIDEFVWLPPLEDDPSSFFAWDGSMCLAKNITFEIRQLMDKAFQGALNLHQQQKLLDELDNDPNLVYHIGLVPSKLPLLVENSPLISIQCLLKLITSNQMTEYLSALVKMDMSLHSMEVVNRLSTSMDLPQEFLQLYIATCIKTCEETKDRFLQNRFVRLVSVFVQSLIRNKVVEIKDLFLDIQGFCINFRHIKEAGALFQLVKSFETNQEQ